MLVRIAAALPALALLGAAQATGEATLPHYSNVVQVVCLTGKGTAFSAGGKTLSVAHVTDNSDCSIKGQTITAQSDPGLDFSVITSVATRGGFPIDCGGFKAGQWYFAIGFAGGAEWQTMTRHLATWKEVGGLRVLLGSPTVIPGMSGGPVLNSDGEVVGVINRYNDTFPFSYSVELKDTSVCRR